MSFKVAGPHNNNAFFGRVYVPPMKKFYDVQEESNRPNGGNIKW